jgi:hypothetical protein
MPVPPISVPWAIPFLHNAPGTVVDRTLTTTRWKTSRSPARREHLRWELLVAEAKDRAWLGEVAALEESLKHLRIRQSRAQQRLSHGINAFNEQRPQ